MLNQRILVIFNVLNVVNVATTHPLVNLVSSPIKITLDQVLHQMLGVHHLDPQTTFKSLEHLQLLPRIETHSTDII